MYIQDCELDSSHPELGRNPNTEATNKVHNMGTRCGGRRGRGHQNSNEQILQSDGNITWDVHRKKKKKKKKHE